MMQDDVHIRVSGARALLLALWPSGTSELHPMLEDDEILAAAFRTVLQLSQTEFSGIDDRAPDERPSPQAQPMAAFLGKRVHLKLHKAARDGIAGCIPFVVKFAASGGTDALVGAAGALGAALAANLRRVEPRDWELCLAIEVLIQLGRPTNESEVVATLIQTSPREWNAASVRECLGRLLSCGVLEMRAKDEYRLVR